MVLEYPYLTSLSMDILIEIINLKGVLMEFFVKTHEAQRAIKLLSVTAKMNTTSFEGQIVIKAEEDSVLFLSNNGKTGISCKVPAKVVKPGEQTVIFSKIKSYIMTFAPWDGEIGVKDFHFISKPPHLHVKVINSHLDESTSKSNLKLDTIKAARFIAISTIDQPNLILNSSIIKSAIDKVLYAVDPNGPTAYIKGIRMAFSKDKINFVSTNGKLISEFIVKNENTIEDQEYLLKHSFIMGLRRVLIDDAQLFMEFSDRSIKVSFDNVLFWGESNVLKTYPNYQKMFDVFDKTVEINREMLVNGLSSFVDVLNGEDYNRVSLKVNDNKLSLSTDNSLFEYDNVGNKDIDFILDVDGKDLLNTLHSMTDDNVELKCLDEKNGLIVVSKGYDDQKAYVVNLVRR